MADSLIYTIGYAPKYEPRLRAGKPLYKYGKGDIANGQDKPGPGGLVWQTPGEALAFLKKSGRDERWRVYGVEADWGCDTYHRHGEPGRRLLRAAPVVSLIDK